MPLIQNSLTPVHTQTHTQLQTNTPIPTLSDLNSNLTLIHPTDPSTQTTTKTQPALTHTPPHTQNGYIENKHSIQNSLNPVDTWKGTNLE